MVGRAEPPVLAIDFPLDVETIVTLGDFGVVLHDAWLEGDTIRHDDDELTIDGYLRSRTRSGWFTVGRYPVRVRATGVTKFEWSTDDGLVEIDVWEVRATEPGPGVRIEGGIGGWLNLVGTGVQLHVTVASEPSDTRRPLGQWVPYV